MAANLMTDYEYPGNPVKLFSCLIKDILTFFNNLYRSQ